MRVLPLRSARHSKTQYIVAALVPALIVSLSITGFVWAQKKVTVVIDGRTQHVETQATDVASMLEESGVKVDGNDLVSPSRDTQLTSGMNVVVRRAVPVTLKIGDEQVRVDVIGDTVADALVAVGADPTANLAVEPALDTKLTENMTITAPDVFVRVAREDVALAPGIEEREDSSLPRGERKVIVAGEPGRALRIFRVLVTNGVESTRTLSAEHVITAPTDCIVAVGTGTGTPATDVAAAKSPAKPPRRGRKVVVEATGYSAAEPGLDSTTATGRRAVKGVIAVDPHFIPLGTRVYVPGYGYAIAADTGGAIKGNRIDLCFNTVAEALQWGRRKVTIIVLDER